MCKDCRITVEDSNDHYDVMMERAKDFCVEASPYLLDFYETDILMNVIFTMPLSIIRAENREKFLRNRKALLELECEVLKRIIEVPDGPSIYFNPIDISKEFRENMFIKDIIDINETALAKMLIKTEQSYRKADGLCKTTMKDYWSKYCGVKNEEKILLLEYNSFPIPMVGDDEIISYQTRYNM